MATTKNNLYVNEIRKDGIFSKAEINSFIKTKQDFIDGKTTARD